MTIPSDAVAAALSFEADVRLCMGSGTASGTNGMLIKKNAIFGIDCLHRIRQNAGYISTCADTLTATPAGFVIFYSSNGKA